jgi:hypothetical protein
MVVPSFFGAPVKARKTENTLPTLPIHVSCFCPSIRVCSLPNFVYLCLLHLVPFQFCHPVICVGVIKTFFEQVQDLFEPVWPSIAQISTVDLGHLNTEQKHCRLR